MNRVILNRKKGFAVSDHFLPCTKGIWMWGKPIVAKTEKGETVNVIVIDSEGLSATDVDSTHDSIVFCLTILLSSVFIYNHMGVIDEESIENLSYISNLC